MKPFTEMERVGRGRVRKGLGWGESRGLYKFTLKDPLYIQMEILWASINIYVSLQLRGKVRASVAETAKSLHDIHSLLLP